jgi:hypothetical protein
VDPINALPEARVGAAHAESVGKCLEIRRALDGLEFLAEALHLGVGHLEHEVRVARHEAVHHDEGVLLGLEARVLAEEIGPRDGPVLSGSHAALEVAFGLACIKGLAVESLGVVSPSIGIISWESAACLGMGRAWPKPASRDVPTWPRFASGVYLIDQSHNDTSNINTKTRSMVLTTPTSVASLEIHDESDSGDDREIVALEFVLDELQVGCQMEPLVDLEVVVELEAPRIAQVRWD